MRSMIVFLMCSIMSIESIAGVVSGTISAIKIPSKKPFVLFELTSEEQGASCATSGWFLVNTNRAGGENQYQLLLSAHRYGQEVTVRTLNSENCSEEQGVSSVSSISIGVPKSEMPRLMPGHLKK